MYADLNNDSTGFSNDLDNVTIRVRSGLVRGGRTLDVTGFAPAVIAAGHTIIKETTTGNFKPMPVTGNPATAYAALPSGHTYAYILSASVLTKKPFASLMYHGEVNPSAPVLAYTQAMIDAFPLIKFLAD